MIGIIINVLTAVAIALFAGIYTKAYLASTAPVWYKKLWEASKVSATLAWSAFVVFSAKILDVIGVFADQVSAGAGDQLRSAVDPKYGAAILIGIMIITVVARLRTLWKAAS